MTRVLVVDDELGLRRAIGRCLRFMGLETDTAENGEEALERLSSNFYDLVLCDVRMPRMGGYDALSEAHKRFAQVPRWVFLTGYADHSDHRLEQAGASVLSKPVSMCELYAFLRKEALVGEPCPRCKMTPCRAER